MRFEKLTTGSQQFALRQADARKIQAMYDDDETGVPGETKLTEWEKEPTVMDLKNDLEASKPAQDAHTLKVRQWNDLRNVTGSAKPKTKKGRSEVQPKLVRRQAEWRYSALSEPFLSSEKMYDLDGVTFEDEASAKQNEIVINWQFRTKLNKVAFIDEYVRTAVDEGTVVVRLGWQRETKMVEVDVPIFQYVELQTEDQQTELQEAIVFKDVNPREYLNLPEEIRAAVDYYAETQVPTVAVIIGTEKVQEEEILVNKPTAEMVNIENFFLDPSCNSDVDKANFAVISFETSKAELLKDGRYKNLKKVNWSGNSPLAQPDHDTETPNDFNFNDDLRKRVVAYEYWGFYDVNGDDVLVPIVATWIGETMVRMEENPFPDQKIPFVVVPYLPVKRQVMGEPDAEILEDNQKILGAVTRGMIDLMGRSANSQQGMAKGFLDTTNRRRFESGQDYEFNPGNGNPDQSIHQHKYPEIPNSALTMLSIQNNEAEAISGVKSYSGGISGEAYGEVAAGIKGVLDASSKREMNILRRLAKGIQQIGVKIISMNGVFLSEEETIRVTNGAYVTIKREDLKGNFDLIVDISTAEVDEAKSQDLGFMLQTMGPNMDPEMSKMILADIATLKRMPALAQKIMAYTPEPDPVEEKMKELTIAKLEADIEEIKAQVQLKRAQAAKAQAEADRTDLDYVEQETGTAHQRDLQKQSEQARSNQDLAVTKGLLAQNDPAKSDPDVEAAVGYNALTDANASNTGGAL